MFLKRIEFFEFFDIFFPKKKLLTRRKQHTGNCFKATRCEIYYQRSTQTAIMSPVSNQICI